MKPVCFFESCQEFIFCICDLFIRVLFALRMIYEFFAESIRLLQKNSRSQLDIRSVLVFVPSWRHHSIPSELTDQNPVILAAVINPGREIHFGQFIKKPSGIRRISECTDLHTVGYRWRRIRKFGVCIFIRRIHVSRV